MIVCDQIIRDGHTGKVTIVGSFNQITGESFPLIHRDCAIYVAITDGEGPYDGVLRVSLAESDEPVLEAGGRFELENPLQVAELNFRIQALVLPKPGKYRIEFFADGDRLTGRTFMARQETPEDPAEGA
jgi:hypothetical protein